MNSNRKFKKQEEINICNFQRDVLSTKVTYCEMISFAFCGCDVSQGLYTAHKCLYLVQ